MSAEQTQSRRGLGRLAPREALSPLVLHTIRMQLRSVLIWGLIVGLYSAALVATFPSLGGQEGFSQIVQSYPEGLREAFSLDALGTIEGFLASQVFDLAPLALAFFTILALAGAIAGAEERGSIDILLGNPVPRWQLVVGSFVATAISLLLILAVVGLLTWLPARLMDVDLSLQTAAAGVLNLWPTCMFFGALALLGSAIFHRRAVAVAIPATLLFVMYLLNVLGDIVDEMEGYQPLSAFYYYGSAIENGIDWANFAGLTAVAVGLVVLAILVFRRRDIYT